MQKIEGEIHQLIPIGFTPNYITVSTVPDVRQRDFEFFETIYNVIVSNDKNQKHRPRWCATDERVKTHIYNLNVHQLHLPFIETRKIDASQWHILKQIKFPSFDRTDSGNLYQKRIQSMFKQNYRKWCYDNCYGRYYVANSIIYFEKCKDYEACLPVSFDEYED